MSAIKNNIDNIFDDTEVIVNDYLKLFSIKLTEKISLFLGIVSSIFIISTLLLIVIIFLSFVLAGYLNKILESNFLGFGIVAALYIILVLILIVKIVKTKTPLLTNLLVKFTAFLFDLNISQSNNLKGLRNEKVIINEKLGSDKEKLKTNFQLLKYIFIENILKEFFSLFSSKKSDGKKNNGSNEENKAK